MDATQVFCSNLDCPAKGRPEKEILGYIAGKKKDTSAGNVGRHLRKWSGRRFIGCGREWSWWSWW